MRNIPDDDGFSIETTALQNALWKVVFTTIVLARIDDVNILVAIRWVAKAWLAIKETTICKCFDKLVY